MSTLEALVHQFARKYPTPASHPNRGDSDWDQDCGQAASRLCLEFGHEPTGDVHSAHFVYTRSRIVSKDPRKALPGDWHFWDIAGPNNGHVMLEVFGGGKDTFGGNHRVRSIEGAVNLGFLDADEYTELSGATYLGFSRGYADGDVAGFTLPAAPAGTPPTPVQVQKEIVDMATGVVYKAKGEATVWWQEKPGTPLIGLWASTYQALLASGVKRGADLSPADMKALLKECGTVTHPLGSSARGVAYRRSDDGTVFWQEKPGTPLIGLSPVEWAALKQNGLQFLNFTAVQLQPLLGPVNLA